MKKSVHEHQLDVSMGTCCSSEEKRLAQIQSWHSTGPPRSNERVPFMVTHVVDGDTIRGAYMIGPDLRTPFHITVRIMGIDTPEKRGNTALEKSAAEIAAKAMVSLCPEGQMVHVCVHRWDKFGGRVVASVYKDEEPVADFMTEQGLAHPYDGKGRKQVWEPAALLHIVNQYSQLNTAMWQEMFHNWRWARQH